MTYATSNPPSLIGQSVGGGMRFWEYSDGDAIATVDAADYFSNGLELGMQLGDIVYVKGNDLTSITQVTTLSGSAVTVVALTAVP